MLVNLRIFFLGIILMGSVMSCTDYFPSRVPEPGGFRLKSTNNINSPSSPFSTEYTYGSTNKVSSFTTSMGTRAVFAYDDQNRYDQITYFYKLTDERNGEITRLTYTSGDAGFSKNTEFIKNGVSGGSLPTVVYKLDRNSHLVSKTTVVSTPNVLEMFSYTGDNITTVTYASGQSATTTKYEYDDRLNPYYGLIAPDIGDIRRFSRNNITKISTGSAVAEYVYEYNEQGFPTRVTRKDGTEEVRYTYESY